MKHKTVNGLKDCVAVKICFDTNLVKIFFTDIVAFQPSGRRDERSDDRAAGQPLIDWDQIREDALKWERKKWSG